MEADTCDVAEALFHDIPISWIYREIQESPAPVIAIGGSFGDDFPDRGNAYEVLKINAMAFRRATILLPYTGLGPADVEAIRVLRPIMIIAIYDITGLSGSPGFHRWIAGRRPYATTFCICVKTKSRVTVLRVWRRLDTIVDDAMAMKAIEYEARPYTNVWDGGYQGPPAGP